jgi:hypothetical protein
MGFGILKCPYLDDICFLMELGPKYFVYTYSFHITILTKLGPKYFVYTSSFHTTRLELIRLIVHLSYQFHKS